MKYLYDSLTAYQNSTAYPFHMPGHKRAGNEFVNPFLIDITEIDQFDNLHHAEGILKEAQVRAAKLYGAEETHFLVNGSTAGILSAFSACIPKGGKILMARNAHKAAYHGVLLNELEAVYLYPQVDSDTGIYGGIAVREIEEKLNAVPDIRAVMITSPTYDGVVTEVRNIAAVVHRHGIPLIVDEAHGAHFGFHPYFPENSVKLGADIVIHSLHKTLPALTQTALLHVNGTYVDREKLRRYLGIYQTSSPSYVLMGSIDECIRRIATQGTELFEDFCKRLEHFYRASEALKQIVVSGRSLVGKNNVFDFDRSKLLLGTKSNQLSGSEMQQILRNRYQLELEMAAGRYALALTSVSDTEEGFVRLLKALVEIDEELQIAAVKQPVVQSGAEVRYDAAIQMSSVYKIQEALTLKKETVVIEESEGRVAAEFLYCYPPGIPLLVPGERINGYAVENIRNNRKNGLSIQGLADYKVKTIQVIG